MQLPKNFFLAALSLWATRGLWAQVVPPTAVEVTALAPYAVTEVPVDQSVNPLTRECLPCLQFAAGDFYRNKFLQGTHVVG